MNESDKGKTAPSTAANARPKTVSRNRWLKDISFGDNLYLQERLVRIFYNLVSRYSGAINDSATFFPIQNLMRREKALEMFERCSSEPSGPAARRGRRYRPIDDPRDEPICELLCALWRSPGSHMKFKRLLSSWLVHADKTLNAWLAGHPDPVEARFVELQRLFGLTDDETDALILETVLANGMWPSDDFRQVNPFQKVAAHSFLLGMSEPDYLGIIGPNSRLRRLGCLDQNGAFNTDILSFITGMDSEPLASRFYKKNETVPLPWTYFGTFAETDGALLKRMIASRQPDHGINILLYGDPGTGKTSFAVALAAELGLTPYFVAQTDDSAERPRPNNRSFRFAALQVCAGQVDAQKSLLVIDEADALLSCGSESSWGDGLAFGSPVKSADKGRLNDTMDAIRLPCVWITNTPAEALDPSNRRRFDFSVRFDSLSQQQREAIWRNALAKYGLETTLGVEAATHYAARYEVSAGGIDLALRNIASMLKAGQITPAESGHVADRLLASHCELLNIRTDDKTGVRADYTPDGLNIKGEIAPRDIVMAVRRFIDEQGCSDSPDPDRPRMNLLFSGPSGTGKTEFVKFLSKATRTPVVTRMGSDLLNKYVGGTERNIRQAFEQAESERAILFLDEADGLFQSRERAERSWEVTQVNELLHRMENFDGVLVCATNFAARLDSATLRRFTYKLAFDYLTTEGKRIFYQRLFTPLGVGDLTPDEDARLARIPALTPGDYRTVRQNLYYLRAELTVDRLLSALERESATKQHVSHTVTIGFKAAV